jgi:phage shock protein A
MSTREDYAQKMHALLDELNDEIDALTERAEHAGADVRDEIAELRARQDEAHTRLASLRHAGEGAWQDLRAGVEIAKDAIGEAIESAKTRFRK